MTAERFSQDQLAVIRWAAKECARQHSGEPSVYWMLTAWTYAMSVAASGVMPSEFDVLSLGALVEPVKNANGYRQCGVRVGGDVKGQWELVPRQMANLVAAVPDLHADEWFLAFEEVHPFTDGNGRVGALLWNWLRGSLADPQEPPECWGPREEIRI